MQRIEQEVGLQLTLQCLQVRLRQLRFEFEGSNLPLREFLLIPNRLCDQDNRQVDRNHVTHDVVKEQPINQDPLHMENVGVRVPHNVGETANLGVPDRVQQTAEAHMR